VIISLRTALALLLFVIPGLPCPADSVDKAPAKAPHGQAADPDYARHIRPFLDKHCIDCHGEDSAKAGLRLDSLAPEFEAVDKARRWTKVLERLEAGDMPPKKQPRPPQAERDQVTAWINECMLDAERRAQPPPESITLRRLTRLQYENTVHDLLAIDLPLKERLPEDNRVLGFDNVGEAQNLSAKQVESYLEAADAAIDAAVVKRSRPETWKRRYRPLELISADQTDSVLDLEDAVVLFGGQFSPHEFHRLVKDEGWYRFRLSAYACRSRDQSVAIEVRYHNLSTEKQAMVGYFDAPPDSPQVIEFVCRLTPGVPILNFTVRKLPSPARPRNVKEYSGPGLAVQWLEIEGPVIDSWPPASHRHLFGDLPLRPVAPHSTVLSVVSEQPRADAERLLRAFMRRAYRRPVSPQEAQPFVDLVARQLDNKKSFEQAMRVGYKAILCSPGFLFFQDKRGQADDSALAARLSYFLWNRTPDDELSQLAERGVLARPDTLRTQVERLLNHPNARGFVENFVAQWLEVRLIDATVPDKKLYPEFAGYDNDVLLRGSIVKEPELFFAELLKRDLSLANFVDADFAILNDRLAQHYGITGVKGSSMRVVKLPPETHRGGVLTQASVLKVTANGATTSPVVRGAWVLRNIVGKPTDPPPPNAGAVEQDFRGTRTIRELLEKHRRDVSCARCHAKIDSLGFALENFDVMGRWRDQYRVLGEPNQASKNGSKVEADYQLPDGRDIRNIDDLKKFLLEDKDQLARALTEKLLIYGTGRGPRFSDRAAVKEIVARLRAKDYGLRSLIHEIVQSPTFLNK
jgi:mono/diheme cytochrome c family protein